MAVETNFLKPTSTDPLLFVNRENEKNQLRSLLRRVLKAQVQESDPDGLRGVLVKGDSGVGKSILSRHIVDLVAQDFIPDLVLWSVDGGRLTGERGLLNKLADVARNETAKLDRPELAKLAGVIAQAADYSKITTSDVTQISKELSALGKVGGRILELISAESTLGWKRTTTNSATTGTEIPITDDFLARLLGGLLESLKEEKFQTLIFLDNLDRIGRMDSQEDANMIAALVKQLLELPACTLLINLRSQFTHHTVDRRELRHFAIEGLKPEALLEIYRQRRSQAVLEDDERKAIEQVPLDEIADKLSRVTENPLAFLRWLDFWLTSTDNKREQLPENFRDFIRHNFTGIEPRWLKKVVDELKSARESGITDTPLTSVDKTILTRLERAGTLVPDSLLIDAAQRRYRLNHDLDFLFDDEFASLLR
jgi:hypothetical protein